MKLLNWLRLADRKVDRAPDLAEYGVTGTPIFGGFLRDAGEYNPTLEGLSAFTTYEKMRRSDAQVAATLMGMKLPLRSAEWAVVAPENAKPTEKEAAEFVRSCLLEEIELDAVVENALLMLDFGCAAHEDVWYVDGNRVRLKKCAPRLPVTFTRWLVQGEDLLGIEQTGYAGDTYKTVVIPADKIALFTFQQEGANYSGRSILRAMYQHWYIKSNLYKIDAIANERNGMGVPWAKMGPEARTEDRSTAIGWLEKLSAHEKAAILLPPGWEWGLKGVEGTLRDPKESIAHHNMAISMAGLAQFMMLGQTESGNRALGQTMSDFFYLGLQATANKMARVLTLSTVKRLVDFNFAGIKRYPKVVPQQILSLRFESVVAALKDLASSGVSAVQPDDELEAWLRNKMGAPKAGEPRKRPSATHPDASPAEKPSSLRGSENGPRPDMPKLLRAPRGAEKFLALADIVSALDRGRDDVAAALRRARDRVQAEIVNKLVNAPVRTLHRVSIAPDEKLIAEIEAVLGEVFEFGRKQVEDERGRQMAGSQPSVAAVIRAADRKQREPLGVYADGAVGEFTNTLTSRAAAVALDWMRRPGHMTKGEIIRKIEEELNQQSDRWIDGVAAKGVNEAFADGRAAGYEMYAEEVTRVIYSALLDWNTCGNCAAADGAEGAMPADIPAVPNPDCDGGDRCRCVHVYVFQSETQAPALEPPRSEPQGGMLADILESAAAAESETFPATDELAGIMEGAVDFQAMAAEIGLSVRQQVRSILGHWTETVSQSGQALALQLAAEREFGLPRKAWDRIAPSFYRQAIDLLERHGPGLQRFLRAIYQLTQGWLQDKGMDRVTLYRGMRMAVPEGTGRRQAFFRALSSFTTSFEVAMDYAGNAGSVWLVEVPASRILSTGQTGLGSLRAREVVVLAGPADLARVVSWSGTAEKPRSPKELFRRITMAEDREPVDLDAEDGGEWLRIWEREQREKRDSEREEESESHEK